MSESRIVIVSGARTPIGSFAGSLSGVDAYELGTAYGHVAVTVDSMDETLAALAEKGIEPERPPYSVREGGSLLCFVRDPDGYRIELIERSS